MLGLGTGGAVVIQGKDVHNHVLPCKHKEETWLGTRRFLVSRTIHLNLKKVHLTYGKTGYFRGHVIFAVDRQSAKINDRDKKNQKNRKKASSF